MNWALLVLLRRPPALSLGYKAQRMALEIFGICAVSAMVLMYALEDRSHFFVLGFAAACAAASLYAILIQSWPFAAVEALWSVIAVRRWLHIRPARRIGAPQC